MRRNKYISILLIFCLFSCEDFLTREPGGQTSYAEQLATEEGVLQALNGLYQELEKEVRTNLFLYADLMGGNYTFSPNTQGNNRGIIRLPQTIELSYNFDNDPREFDYDDRYDNLYEVIASVNVILSFLPESNVVELNKERIRSELIAIRGYCHFILTNLFAQHYAFTDVHSHLGIAYIDRPLEAGVDFPVRLTIAETYERIVDDLTTALNTGDGMKLLGFLPDYAHLSKTVIKSILARVEIYRENWEAALDWSNQVIAEAGSLTNRDNYVEEWKDPDFPISETIWELPPDIDQAGEIGFSISMYFFYQFDTAGDPETIGDFVISKDLLDLFSDTDIRKASLIREIILFTITEGVESNESYFFTEKFQGNPGTPIFRLSELFLIRAEANAQLGNLEEALTDVNIIRLRADTEASSLSDLTQAEVIDAVLLERRKELALEGHLFFDLMRYKQDVVRNQGCLSDRCNVLYPSNLFVLPIPLSTILVNENMIQNEGY